MLKKSYTSALFLLSLCTILLIPSLLTASTPADSIKQKIKKDSTRVSFFYKDFDKSGKIRLHAYDTALDGTQEYDPLYKQNRFSATPGNIGLSSASLLPSFLAGASGFDYGIHSTDLYLFKNDSVKYYKVLKAFSCIEYEQGAKKEIFFHTLYSRNIYKGLSLGFDFRVLNAPGAYLRQKSNHINFYLTAQYFTKNKRCGVIANFLINRLKNQENGGITYDSLFTQNLETNRQLFDVNLSKAQNRVRETGFYMKHYFNLSRHSVSSNDTTHYFELGRVSYSFEYNRQIQNYLDADPQSGFYPAVTDTVSTFDSVTIKRYSNEISWTNPSFRSDRRFRVIQLGVHMKHNYIEVTDHSKKDYFLQYIPSADFSFTPIPSIHLEANADYVFGDHNEGDKSLNVLVNLILGKEARNLGILTLQGSYAAKKPGWFFEHYLGNNFQWDTAFLQQNILSLGSSYSFRNILDAGVTFSRINHYAYLDATANPEQFNSEFGHLKAYVNTNITIWHLTFKGQFAYQTIQGTSIVHLPAFLGNLTIFLTEPLFKGAALFQPGISVFYNTKYYADAYMPATRSFYLQNTEQTGNYPYLDVYINVKIQRAKIFVRYNHINAGLMERYYYMVPGYPMPDAAFHFGFSWRFHD